MADAAAATRCCPHCQASNPPGAKDCWLCEQPLDVVKPEPAGALGATAPGTKRTFHLNSLMALIALVAVLLGLFRENTGLGIFAAVIMLPALLRLRSVAAQRRARDQPMTLLEKVLDFLCSTGIALAMVVVLGASAIVSFLLICASGGAGLGSLFLNISVPMAAGVMIVVMMARFLWKRRR